MKLDQSFFSTTATQRSDEFQGKRFFVSGRKQEWQFDVSRSIIHLFLNELHQAHSIHSHRIGLCKFLSSWMLTPSLRRWADGEMCLLAKRLLRDSPNVRTNFWWKVWFVKKESPKPNLAQSLSKDLRGYAFLSSHNKLLFALLCTSQQPHHVWLETHKLSNMEPG